MINYLEDLFSAMRPAFSRQATFAWFVITCVGFIMRYDNYGVSSIIRALYLLPIYYPCLLHFFHSSAWSTEALRTLWWQWLIEQRREFCINGMIVLTGDHTKNVKDGRKIPLVETLHQDSETSSKPSFFRGHLWGCVGLLVQAGKKIRSAPMWAEIHHDNLPDKRSTRIVFMALSIIRSLNKKGYLILDAFFAVEPVLLLALNCDNNAIHIITRAKKNVTAYKKAPQRKKKKRGRRRIYGKKLKLMKLFDSKRVSFKSIQADIYGTNEAVKYCTLDLLWKPVKGILRFILVESSHGRIILMTTDTSLSAQTAISLYCKRTSIETLFNTMKNTLGAFGYHFWSKYLKPVSRSPKKKNGAKRRSTNPEKTKKTFEAIEKFVTVQLVVLGALQLVAIKFNQKVFGEAKCWLRTKPDGTPSEFITKIALTNVINHNLTRFAKNTITQLILKKRNKTINQKYFNEAA